MEVGGFKVGRIPLPPAWHTTGSELAHRAKRMRDLKRSVVKVNSAHDKTVLHRQIAALDRRIDRMVYELYGLTDDEIQTVEEAVGR